MPIILKRNKQPQKEIEIEPPTVLPQSLPADPIDAPFDTMSEEQRMGEGPSIDAQDEGESRDSSIC